MQRQPVGRRQPGHDRTRRQRRQRRPRGFATGGGIAITGTLTQTGITYSGDAVNAGAGGAGGAAGTAGTGGSGARMGQDGSPGSPGTSGAPGIASYPDLAGGS